MPKISKETSTFVYNTISGSIVLGVLVFCAGIYFNIFYGLPDELCYGAIILSVAIMIGVPTITFINHNKEVDRKYKGIQIANVDSMTGIEFEQYLQKLLTNQGYSVNVTQASGDLGVDLIASRDGDKIAIQAKRYSTNVSRRAISDAVAGMYHYNCNKAMVITNSYFSPGAKELAESTECILINRDTLSKWVNEFQNTESAK